MERSKSTGGEEAIEGSCYRCGSTDDLVKNGKYKDGRQRYKCKMCAKRMYKARYAKLDASKGYFEGEVFILPEQTYDKGYGDKESWYERARASHQAILSKYTSPQV